MPDDITPVANNFAQLANNRPTAITRRAFFSCNFAGQHTKQKKMTKEDQRQECVNLIAHQILKSAEWANRAIETIPG